MRAPSLFVGCVAIVLAASATWTALAAQTLPAPDAGESFYRQGRMGDGTTVEAVVQQDIRVESSEMPCVNCHRRSGWGTAEGPVTTPPVIGSALFAPVTRGSAQMGMIRTTGAGTRPAYTEATLLRAVRDGIDPAGRTLSPTMPRYAIGAKTADALAAYLRSLSADAPAGVTSDAVHFATIVTPGDDAGRRASLLAVLETYVRHKNANTRNETGRRERGPWDMAHDFQNYRRWVLHEWTLRGEPREWSAQLDDWYQRQPVFAVISGLADEDWTPVHAFAERLGLPVVLPQVAAPPADGACDSFYCLYFSKGLALEANLLAHHLQVTSPAARVAQVWRCGTAGEAAAQTLAVSAPVMTSQCVEKAVPLSQEYWARVAANRPEAVVLWLGPEDLDAVGDSVPGPSQTSSPRIYLSSTLLGERIRSMPAGIVARASVVHPFVPPDDLDGHAFRALAWLKANAIEPADRSVAINALFAASLVADAISIPRTLGSREYFIERIEHMASRSPHRSTYPAVTFGPQRRFASDGGYILAAPHAPDARFGKVAEWFVPSH